jgi:hypothetical protein
MQWSDIDFSSLFFYIADVWTFGSMLLEVVVACFNVPSSSYQSTLGSSQKTSV